MRKKLLYAGAIVFVVGLVLALVAVQWAIPSGAVPASNALVLGAGSPLSYVRIFLNQSGMVVLTYNATSGVNFYFANQSAFNAISAASASGRSLGSTAAGLEGSGVYAVYNGSAGTFPFSSSQVPYLMNATMLSGGNYYALFSSRSNATNHVTVNYLRVTQTQLGSTYMSVILGGVSVLLMIAGIIIAIVSLFLKPKEGARERRVAQMDEAARKEYRELEKRQKSESKAKK
jgi:hypothetical protein